MPTWSIVPSRFWRAQTAFLARHAQVTTFDGRGSGLSDRPAGAAAYVDAEYAADALAVMDATDIDAAVLVGFSRGVTWSIQVGAAHPDRVHGIVAVGAACVLDAQHQRVERSVWSARQTVHEGWASYNERFWRGGQENVDTFLKFFFAQAFPEPHSTKQIEDGVRWGQDAGADVLVDTTAGRLGLDEAPCLPLDDTVRALRCPVLVLHGTDDGVQPIAIGERLAELAGAPLVRVEGGGHGLPAREPVLVNHEILAFVRRVVGDTTADAAPPRPRSWGLSLRRPRRALFLSSPIGLGHARRDLAVADELQQLHPDLEIDWLAQDPVDRMLRHRGRRVHPASAWLASESTHVESECSEHDLHAFEAIRRMDEILVANFMVFDEVTRERHYDLVVGDEAWEVDHFLHENPELKRSAFAWLTDFVGWLPVTDDERERALTTDQNAEMIAHRARFPGLRDRSLFVGDPDDVVDLSFGADLPGIRPWTQENFAFCGYVSGAANDPDEDREALRARLGYRDDEQVFVVAVGGSAVGLPLLRRIAAAVPTLRRGIPALRVVIVTGPRIDPNAVAGRDVSEVKGGLEVHGFLPDLDRHLLACDVAVVQGGLSTTMELTQHRRPFLYVPLRNHFEQQIHVRHRLERHRAGHRLDYAAATDPDVLTAAVATALATPVDYRPVGTDGTDGAGRAARLIADLL
jgi:pimeloyl-ACP methyl ester carboxylesterase/predicted glycosyltransferase